MVGRGDERRVVTVLFADLAGFTGLSESADPEQLKNLLDRCFARLAVDITGHGGRVDKVIGDAIVALFGAPVAHEDDAERAVRAGLQMQCTMKALSEELDMALAMRVGINTGEVLVGEMRAGGDYTAMGDVVNVASRLETMAAPGAVVVGAATHAATAAVVKYRSLGELRARGREELVRAWEAIECMLPPGRRPLNVVGPLVGRELQMGVLQQFFAGAAHGRRAHLAVVIGDAGIGKSRLMEELGRWATAEHNALVLAGRCVPYGEANPWWPLAEAVRQACGIHVSDDWGVAAARCRAVLTDPEDPGSIERDPEELAQHVAGLMYLLGDDDAMADVDPQRAQQEGRRAMLALIDTLAARRPVLLVLSEMHWSDDVVLDLLSRLDRLDGLPVMVVVTARPELEDRWQPPARGRHNLVTVHLDPLDARATRELAAILLGEEAPDAVIDALVERSGGNPFFLEELVSYLDEASAGELASTASTASAGGLAGGPRRPGELPITLRGLVAARLDSLPLAQRVVLQDAAVIGRSGTLAALASLGDRQDAHTEDALVGLLSRDLLVVDAHRWDFRSEVVRDVVYDTLTKSERARRHWALAMWLSETEARSERQDEVLEQLAHHLATAAELVAEVGSSAGVPPDAAADAVDALTRAAHVAAEREFLASARRLHDRAAALAPPGPIRDAILVDRAEVLTGLRELDTAETDLAEVLQRAGGTLRAQALTVLGSVKQIQGQLATASSTLADALRFWRELGDLRGEGEALRRAGTTSFLAGDPKAAEDALSEALSIAKRLGNGRDQAWASWNLAWVAFSAGQMAAAEERLADARHAFRQCGDVGGLGWVKGLLGWVRLVQGRREEAEVLAVALLEEMRDRGDRWALGMVLVLLATVRLWQGKSGASLAPAAEAAQVFSSIDDETGLVRALCVKGRALANLGRVADTKAIQDDLLQRHQQGRLTPISAELTEWRAGVAVHLGDAATALEAVNECTISWPLAAMEWRPVHGSALLIAGQVTEACAMLEESARALTDAEAQGGARDGVARALRPGSMAALAMARVALGNSVGADQAAGEALANDPEGIYHDRSLAHLAQAFAAAHTGRFADMQRAVEAARSVVGATDDAIAQGVVELARAHLGWAIGDPAGPEEVARAAAALKQLGAGDGWDTLFRIAARPTTTTPPQIQPA